VAGRRDELHRHAGRRRHGRQPARYLRVGETVTSWIEGIGTIRNRLVADEPESGTSGRAATSP